MKQEETILKLIKKLTKLTEKIHKYQSTPRDYGTGDKLYMREAHFIDAVGTKGEDMGKLAQKLGVSNGAISQLASRLEKKNCVYRVASEDDSRCVNCFLTEQGKEIFSLHKELDKKNYAKFLFALEDFSEEELEICNVFMERIFEVYAQGE